MKAQVDDPNLSISQTLFGISKEDGDAFADQVKKIMNEQAEVLSPEMSDEDAVNVWKHMYADIVTLGMTENERLWLTFTFGTLYARNDMVGEMRKAIRGMVGEMIKAAINNK